MTWPNLIVLLYGIFLSTLYLLSPSQKWNFFFQNSICRLLLNPEIFWRTTWKFPSTSRPWTTESSSQWDPRQMKSLSEMEARKKRSSTNFRQSLLICHFQENSYKHYLGLNFRSECLKMFRITMSNLTFNIKISILNSSECQIMVLIKTIRQICPNRFNFLFTWNGFSGKQIAQTWSDVRCWIRKKTWMKISNLLSFCFQVKIKFFWQLLILIMEAKINTIYKIHSSAELGILLTEAKRFIGLAPNVQLNFLIQ